MRKAIASRSLTMAVQLLFVCSQATASVIIPAEQCPLLNNQTAVNIAAKAGWKFTMQPNYGHLVSVATPLHVLNSFLVVNQSSFGRETNCSCMQRSAVEQPIMGAR
jgi:hypothetical protein